MRKIIILCSILLIAIIAISVKYFSKINRNGSDMAKTLLHIPEDGAVILNFKNNEAFLEIFRDYELFDAIIGEARAAEINQLQEILLRNARLSEFTTDKNIFISFHTAKTDSIELLFSLNLNADKSLHEIEESLLSITEFDVKLEGNQIYRIKFPSLPKPFFLWLDHESAYGSFDKTLLSRCMDETTPKLSTSFIENINSSNSQNQNSPVNLFINHDQIADFISHFLKGKPDVLTGLLNKARGHSSLNMNFKSDALMFNGISTPDTSSVNYLNLFLTQRPVKNDLKNILPENTANFVSFGLSEYSTFKKHLNLYLEKRNLLSRLEYQFNLVKKQTGFEIDKEIKPFLGNEFCVVEGSDTQKIGIVKVLNGNNLALTLQPVTTQLSEEISLFNNSNIPFYFFGDPFKIFMRPYFSIIDNYLIIANTQSALQHYLSRYKNAQFLIKTPQFASYNQLLANQSNILFFVNRENSQRIIKNDLKEIFAQAFEDNNYHFQNFYGFSYQWSADKDHFFTNVYINYTSSGDDELEESWKFQLDGGLALQPQIMEPGSSRFLMVEDTQGNVFALSEEGKKLWGSYIQDDILGSFQLLNDSTILFNTRNKLYLKNLQGTDLNGFPVTLPYKATSNASVMHLSNADSKIFVPAGNLIMAFNTAGDPLPNWNKSLNDKILFDLKIGQQNSTNYVIAGTEQGKFYFFNHTGNLIYRFDDKSGNKYKSQLFLEQTEDPATSRIITTDTAGNLTEINFKGDFKRTPLLSPGKRFRFDYKNISGDERPEAIYLDDKGLNVFTNEGIPVFTYNFRNSVNYPPLFCQVNSNKYQLALSDTENGQFLLFNEDGTLSKGFPVDGKGYFQVSRLKGGIRHILAAGRENFLYAWKLP